MITKPVEQAGFTYIYLSNESNTSHDVYFDDLRITHTKSKILQENHYYPFGANISTLSSSAPLSKPNRYKLSGNEEQTDFDFNARTYDPILGRFMQIDPMADLMNGETPYHYVFNNPLILKDPSGLFPTGLGSGSGNEGSWWQRYKDSFNGDDFCQCYRAEMGAPDNDYNINSQTGETTVTETDDDFDRV